MTDPSVIVVVDEQQRAYIPIADYEALRQILERYVAALDAISRELEALQSKPASAMK